MKRILITPEQLVAINEASINYGGTVNGTTTTPMQIASMANSFFASNPSEKTVMYKNTNPSASGPAKMVDTNSTDISTGFSDATSYVVDKQNESRRYSKRQVELGRMLEMRRTGKVYSKQQLDEMFMETADNADRLRAGIGNCRLFDIFKALEEVFPEELDGVKDAFSNGSDVPEYIISNIFGKGDVNQEKENEFLNALGL